MSQALAHRGPDVEGFWVDAERGLALAHRRLSILDLTEAGSQPMRSSCGRFVLTYNGECYNFVELREELEKGGCRFRGHSDTEVIVEGCARWGIRETLLRLNGMFAFAIWDNADRRLVLARDRIGIKPLYYGWSQGVFWFGSELKAVQPVAELDPRLNLRALGLFFKYGYIPAPACIFEGFHKLPAGHLLELSSVDQLANAVSYWGTISGHRSGSVERFKGSAEEAVEQLDLMLRKSVKQQMVSDVPLGAFLSGGVDSSTVVAMMQAQSTRPIKTFTIGFGETEFNETAAARIVSSYLGTEHTELTLTSTEALDIIPTMTEIFDEPFADSSQLPTYVLSRLTRQYVTVSLSGDGGDELFAGYNHYPLNASRLRKIERLPTLARVSAKNAINLLSEERWDRIFGWAVSDPAGLNGFKLRRQAAILSQKSPQVRYELMTARWFDPHDVLPNLAGNHLDGDRGSGDGLGAIDMMALWDLETYLSDDVLTKLDRASMAVSLECRVPILDHEIVEFALTLPLSIKRRNGEGKWILHEVLRRYIPQESVNRPKQGFTVPVGQWLKGPLRDWGEELLGSSRLASQGLLDVPTVRRKWKEHIEGKHDWQKLLWPVIMFEAWSDKWSAAVGSLSR